jgi:hypothetical protein
MPWVGFEPTIPAFERAKAVHALDRAANVIGCITFRRAYYMKCNVYWSSYTAISRRQIHLFNLLAFQAITIAICSVPSAFVERVRYTLRFFRERTR